MKTVAEHRAAYNEAAQRVQDLAQRIEDAPEETTAEEYEAMNAEIGEAVTTAERSKKLLDDASALHEARSRHKPLPVEDGDKSESREITVTEPDLYGPESDRSFMVDLYQSTLRHSRSADERIQKHHEYMLSQMPEKRAVATATLGGIIPPAYLIDLYAKALRNGRVYANQANNQPLPDVGMSVVIPRLTTGLAAGVQTAESTAVTTQDPVEADLSVPVRTIAGYSPVSRQTLERAAYSDQILMEDLTARYFAALDTQCINGSGASGQILGVLNTAGLSTSTVATATVAAVWPKIADLIQQINTATGGLGYTADKVIMHPRRYGFFSAALDGQGRPLLVPAAGGTGVNVMGAGGDPSSYGYTGTNILGLPVYTDANIPTNLGAGTNEDRIIVQASQVVHLFERPGDPVTLSFEQQAGTSLQVQLVCYGYAAFTAGRYPAASGVISSTGLVPPTF